MFNETMSIEGGIDEYSFEFERYGEGDCNGRKVFFLGKNGYDSERKTASNLFAIRQILTVEEIYVSRSSSKVEFKEYPNKSFNTVMFADVVEEEV